jgi:hypothetical protein
MKNLVLSLLLLVLGSGLAAAAPSGPGSPDQARFDGLAGRPMILELRSADGPMVGAEIAQKGDADGFCRRYTPVVPNATSTYQCFWKYVDGRLSKKYYRASRAPEIGVTFYTESGDMLLGSSWAEREATLYDGDLKLLCVKTAAVVPHPVPAYQCYTDTPMMGGGGISGGN